jgi:O-antigen/teichoic acid export membrane protein
MEVAEATRIMGEPDKVTRTSRAFAGTTASLLQYVFIVALQFLLAPVVLKTAGSEVLGAYSILMQVIGWASLTDLGFNVAITRGLAQATGTSSGRQHFSKIFTTGRTFYIGSNLAFSSLIAAFALNLGTLMPLSGDIEAGARTAILLYAVWVTVRTPLALYSDALAATQNLAAANIISGLGSVLRLLLSLVLVALGKGLVGLMLANVIAEATTLTCAYLWYRRCYPSDRFGWGITDRQLFKEMLGFGTTYLVMVVAGRLATSTDSIIIGYLFGASAVSVYYTSQMPGTMLYQLIWRISDNSSPAFNELHGMGANSRLISAYLRILRYSCLVAIPLSIGIVGFNKIAITTWVGSPQYAGALLTGALAIYATTQVVNHANAMVLVANGDITKMSIFSVCVGTGRVVLAFGLAHWMGIQGVMVASALVDLPAALYFGYSATRTLGLTLEEVWRSSLVPAIRVGVMTAPVSALVAYLEPAARMSNLLLWCSLFGVVWILSVAAQGLLPGERRDIQCGLARKIRAATGRHGRG